LSTLTHKRYDFVEKYIEHKMCVLISSTNLSETFLISKKNSATYCHKCTKVVTSSTRYFSQILMKLEFPQTYFIKIVTNIKFRGCTLGSEFSCGRTDMMKLRLMSLRYKDTISTQVRYHSPSAT